MSEETQVQIVNKEINRELADPKTVAALLATTFKGLDVILMKQAITEGMLLGFNFKNFLQRDVYALPFNVKDGNTWKKSYSLITSIGYARKIAQKSGQCGKKEPVYTMKAPGEIETCSVTVQKKIGEYVGDYTATVYFDEYNNHKNLWNSKPRTMIAKVAEMHALRSAFPEELDKIYVEEEFDKGSRLSEVADEVEKKDLSMGKFVKKDVEITKEAEDKKEPDQTEDLAGANSPFAK